VLAPSFGRSAARRFCTRAVPPWSRESIFFSSSPDIRGIRTNTRGAGIQAVAPFPREGLYSGAPRRENEGGIERRRLVRALSRSGWRGMSIDRSCFSMSRIQETRRANALSPGRRVTELRKCGLTLISWIPRVTATHPVSRGFTSYIRLTCVGYKQKSVYVSLISFFDSVFNMNTTAIMPYHFAIMRNICSFCCADLISNYDEAK